MMTSCGGLPPKSPKSWGNLKPRISVAMAEAKDFEQFTPEVGNFRFAAKKIGLTYAAPVGEVHPIESCEELLAFLETVASVKTYVVGRELHKDKTEDGADRFHFHAWCEFNEKFETRNARIFDCKGAHPNIIKPKSNAAWQGYCKKDGDFITNIKANLFKRALEADTLKEGEDILADEAPRDYVIYHDKFESAYKRRRYTAPQPILYYGPYNHIEISAKIETAFKDNMSVVVRGPSGWGKTQFIRYTLAHMNAHYFYCKGSIQGMKNYRDENVIFFDDISVMGDDLMKWNTLMDVENGGQMRVLYGTAEILPGVKRIFLTNAAEEGGLVIPKIPSIQRRFTEINI